MVEGLRVLVLGAGGFIGSALCRALIQQGAIVQGFGRSVTFAGSIGEGVVWTPGHLSDSLALAKAVQGQQIVFHLISGSLPESSNRDPAADLSANAVATLSLLDLCKNEGVRKVIFASSGGVIYGIPESVPIAETAATDPISAYGISKLAIEKYLRLYHHLYGLDYHVFRVANPYGHFQSPFRKQGVVAVLMHRMLHGLPPIVFGDDRITRDYIHVDDVADALIAGVAYEGRHRVMNVGSGVGQSLDTIIVSLEAAIGLPRQTRVYEHGRAADVPVNVLDTSLIRRETGWRPRVEWMEGLRHTCAWMRSAIR